MASKGKKAINRKIKRNKFLVNKHLPGHTEAVGYRKEFYFNQQTSLGFSFSVNLVDIIM